MNNNNTLGIYSDLIRGLKRIHSTYAQGDWNQGEGYCTMHIE